MRKKPLSRRSTFRLSVEQLEDRCVPSAYALTNLGTLGGSPGAEANDINDAGQVVGQALTAGVKDHGFLWSNGVMTDLGTLPTGSTSKGIGLNNNGQVVGYAFDGSAAGGATNHAFLWESGVMTDLIPAPQWSSGNAVNDLGQVVGTYNLNHPFIWEGGVLTDLGDFFGGSSFGYALDVNNAGQVVGSSFSGIMTDGLAQHAFLWQNGVMTNLGVLPGMEDSRALGINELGQVVGFSSLFDPETTDEVFRAFLYSGGVMTDLNLPDGSIAHDINDSGQIVGQMLGGGAFIYENGVATNLNSLIPPGSGLSLQEARGINNAGQIVGRAFGGGRSHAFLLTPVAAGTPTVSIGDVTVTEGNAGTTNAVFTVTLSAPASGPVTVDFATSNGTATAGSDYSAQSGTVTFAAGDTTAFVTVEVQGDTIAESNENFQVSLSLPVGAVIGDGQGVGTIVDDEPRLLTISDVAMLEGRFGTKVFKFTVTLSAASAVPVTVNFATANGTAKAGSDYIAQSGTLTFAPGQTSKTISIVVKGDRLREGNETFFVNLSGVVGALLQDGQGVGTILNDD